MLKQTLLRILPIVLFFSVFQTHGATMTTKEYKLDNGLRIIVREDNRSPVVVSQVWYKVGSADEYSGVTGISHALEHMMFKGTKKYPGDSYSEIISKNGGTDNAFTTDDFTAYYAELDASKLELSFELEADRMQNLIISDEDFASEKQVVMEERRLRTDDNPQRLTFERFMAAANIAGPYHHPVVGWMHDIDQLTAQDLRDWYNNWYGPNNAILVVVGDVDADDVYDLAKKHFGKLDKVAPLKGKKFQEVDSFGTARVTVNRPANLPYLIMGFNIPAVHSFSEDKSYVPYALLVAAYALDGGESSRFAKELIRGQEIAVDARAYFDAFKRYPGQFTLTGVPAGDKETAELEQAILAEIEKLKQTPLGERELQKIKNQIIAGEIFNKDSMSEQAIMIGAFESIGLSYKDADAYVSQVKKVTPEQVQEVMNTYFVPERMTIAELKPQPISVEGTEHE